MDPIMLVDSESVNVNAIALFVALLCACIIIGHLLEKARWLNESITAVFIGLLIGIVVLFTSKEGLSSNIFVFNEELLFIYLLPPIIFNAGFQVKKKQFFRNFVMISLFGAAGTLISFAVISAGSLLLFKNLDVGFLELGDYLAIGAIFSATDSVCTLQVLKQDEMPNLYGLVFGEGVVNDATSIVLFNAIQKFDLSHITSSIVLKFTGNFFYLFITSTILGVAAGLLSAWITKKLYMGRHSTDREVALMILMAYLSYITAELFNLSGILTVFFCGIVMSHYTWHNVNESSRVTTKHTFATLSFIAEDCIFLYVGIDALDIEKWGVVNRSPGTSIGLSSILLGLVLLGRAASIFPLSLVANILKMCPDGKITLKQQVTVWWAGLMRGAVSMALAYNQFAKSGHTQILGNAFMITSTITIVLFTTVVFGLLTKPLMSFLLPIKRKPLPLSKSLAQPLVGNDNGNGNGNDNDDSATPDQGSEVYNVPRPTSLKMLLSYPAYTAVHYYWKKFDKAVMQRMFGGRGFSPVQPGTPTDPVVLE